MKKFYLLYTDAMYPVIGIRDNITIGSFNSYATPANATKYETLEAAKTAAETKAKAQECFVAEVIMRFAPNQDIIKETLE